MKKKLPSTVKLFCISIVLIFIIYLLTIFISFDFYKIISYSSYALTFLAIILSGALVSGDRQRGNYHTNPETTTQSVNYGLNVLIFALPFYLVLLFEYIF